jgi:hypothetical protein
MGYLDKAIWINWEAHLHGKELDDWLKLKGILASAGPDFRAAATNFIFEAELQEARNFYAEAVASGERYRADLIRANADNFKAKVAWLDEPVAEVVALLPELEALAQRVQKAQQRARDRIFVLGLMRSQLRKVAAPWGDCWPGAARGRGISGYDTPSGVAEVAREVEYSRRSRSARPRRADPAVEEGQARPAAGPPQTGLFQKP